MEAQEDESFPGQPKSVYEPLTCPKKYICLPRPSGCIIFGKSMEI